MRVVFDEGHAETWSTHLEAARELSPLNPEYHYAGHLAELVTDLLGVEVETTEDAWEEGPIEPGDVVVILHPSTNDRERALTGRPSFSPTERDRLADIANEGVGLLVASEWEHSRWGSNLNELLEPFGTRFTDESLRAPRDNHSPHIASRHFVCSDVSPHEVTNGIGSITYHRGCGIEVEGSSIPLVRSPGGQVVVAAASMSNARAVVLGDSDLFSIPYIGLANNARLFLNAVVWLGAMDFDALGPYGSKLEEIIRKRSYPLREPETKRELTEISGSHIVDVQDAGLEHLVDERLRALPSPYRDVENFLAEAGLAFQEMPRAIREPVMNFRRTSNRLGVLLLRELPIDETLPPTPQNAGRSDEKSTFRSEFMLAAVAEGLGDAFAYSQEKDGEMFQTVAPAPQMESVLSSESSESLLDFHTESAFHPFLPDYLLLLCLREDHDAVAYTIVSSVREIVERLPLRYRSALFEEDFRTGIDYSFGSPSGVQGNGPLVSVLYGNDYDPLLNFDLDLMVAMSEDGQQALHKLKEEANNVKRWVRLKAGDLLVVDNRRAVHGRTEFTPRFDGMDRWLQRVYVARHLALSEEHRYRNERIIQTEFLF